MLIPDRISTYRSIFFRFTSGSTGQPKGVLVTHRNATQAILAHTFVPRFQRFLNFASITFDVSVLEIFLPWLRGKTLVSASRPLLLADLEGVINKLDVDACELTPTVAGLLDPKNLPSLRVVLTIGEKLTKNVIELFGSANILYNTYGPTEAAIQCTAAVTGTEADFVEGDIGVPLATSSVIVANVDIKDHVDCLPVGWLGEIIISGSQVAKGYLNRPDLTSAAFIEDSKYGRCYRTGDLARALPNGRIVFVGRITEGQVKIRGRRIELGEIEYACQVPAVAMAFQNQLFVVVDQDPSVAMRNCQQTLPGYMLPDQYVMVDQIPILSSGKTDRKAVRALIEREVDKNTQTRSTADFDSEIEYSIAKVIQEILGFLPGPTDSFKKIGIDSIIAMRLLALMKTAVSEASFTLVSILKADSIRKLLSFQGKPHPHTTSGTIVNMIDKYSDTPRNVVSVTKVSRLQLGMLLQWSRNHRLYSNRITVEMKNVRKRSTVIAAFKALIDRHEILRTGFKEVEDENIFVQLVYRDSSFVRIVDALGDNGFDSLLEPPICLLLKESSDSSGLIVEIMIHHAIYDGWAFDTLLTELDSLIFHPNSKLGKPSQFREIMPYVSRSVGDLKFWQRYLDGFSGIKIPKLMPPNCEESLQYAKKKTWQCSVPISEIETFCRHAQISVQSIFSMAWALILRLLSADSDSDDIVFGIVISQRPHLIEPGLESAIGPMISTMPLRVRFIDSLSVVLQNINNDIIEIMQNSDVSLQEVAKSLKMPTEDLFRSLFVWQQSDSPKSENIAIVKTIDYLEVRHL